MFCIPLNRRSGTLLNDLNPNGSSPIQSFTLNAQNPRYKADNMNTARWITSPRPNLVTALSLALKVFGRKPTAGHPRIAFDLTMIPTAEKMDSANPNLKR